MYSNFNEMSSSLDIFNMKLHDYLDMGADRFVMRVSGGWIYSIKADNHSISRIFVPYNEELKTEK